MTPFLQYNSDNTKVFLENFKFKSDLFLKLLFTKKKVPEFSRSKIPFVATFCFTDHCDFDSLLLIQKQRELFKELNIKTTKGFFLKHFSKRKNNISFENEESELKKWNEDGHELAYHSLTQSIRNRKEAIREFKNFIPPQKNITTIPYQSQVDTNHPNQQTEAQTATISNLQFHLVFHLNLTQ